MPFVAPKTISSASSSGGPGGGGRATFRPPWVKDDGAPSTIKSTNKTSVPWAKKGPATPKEKENGQESSKVIASKKITSGASAAPATTSTDSTMKSATENNKAIDLKKKEPEPMKKVVMPSKKPSEPLKKASTAAVSPPSVGRNIPTTTRTTAAAKEKEPSPSTSEETDDDEEESEESEEDTEETEEESEEETEEDDSDEMEAIVDKKQSGVSGEKKPPSPRNVPAQSKKENESESELKQRFTLEKPKLRPVVIKRDKSKKRIEDDEDAVEGETEEERERRLRFKLEKPTLRHVKREEKPLPNKSTENVLKIRPVLKKVPKVDDFVKDTKEEPKPEFKTKTLRKTASIKREPSKPNVPAPPQLPALAPKGTPPPPPPPPGLLGKKKELTPTQKTTIDKLRTRPRKRPDWSEMMKEVEEGKKLRHVECNDRSQPILTCKSMTKVDDKFIYETEKDNSHNKLLKQIQGGVRLRPTQTNDRSRPFLDGLRKFRRQMTIEEQLQRSQSKINMLGAGGEVVASDGTATGVVGRNSIVSVLDDPSGDELDDIDKIRDDLQSTKQMLALELRNREAQERENKKLLAKIATLEAELVREKSREKNLEYGSNVIVATMETTPASELAYVNSLKKEIEDARKTNKELERKYQENGELLDQAKIEVEDQKRQIQILERKLSHALQGGGSLNGSRRPSDALTGRDSSPDFDMASSESDPDEPKEKKAERRERKLNKEVKVMKSKLSKLRVKQEAAKKEKLALKQAMKKNHLILKEENKKFKKLEKEVHKMAASMREDEDDDDEKSEKNEEEPEAEEEASDMESEEESDDSESEASEPETQSESEAEGATNDAKKTNLEPRVKKHEGRLSAMKKCNVLLQANVDNLQDEITQVRARAASLQAELDSVLQDLGF